MKIVVVAHGPPVDLDQPVSGGALRASVHVNALEGAGHEVVVMRRAQDAPGGFTSPRDLRRKVSAARPDAVLCVAVEEAGALRGIAPLCVDLYAPRLLEAAWQGTQSEQAGVALRAVHAADEVLFSNPRQRWFWLGILGLAGWDLAQPCGRVVPLACLPGPGRTSPALPYVLMAGPRWPWQDGSVALAEAVRAAGGRAEVRVYGAPSGVAGVREMGMVSRREWLEACAGAGAMLDRYAPHQERELAMSFRQMDALAAGSPLISDADTPLGEQLRRGAGWVDGTIAEAVEAALSCASGAPALSSDRSAAVQALAATYAPAVTEAPLLAWVPTARARGESVVGAGARVAAATARALTAEGLQAAAVAEVASKRAEVEALHGQVRALVSAVESSAAAVADVAAFRRETVGVLGARLAGADATREQLAQHVERLRADLDKKNAEIDALTAERDRLQRVFRWR